jgi:FkbM family methyltransferase
MSEVKISKKTVDFNFENISLQLTFEAGESAISHEIEKTSCWEPWQLVLYKNLLHSENPTFLDIGANVGVNSLFAKARCPQTRVIAVEPAPINLILLQENIKNSSLDVEVISKAVSDHNGNLQLIGDATHAHIGMGSSKGTRVRSVQLDELTKNEGIKSIDLLKIDVEGYTDLVLTTSEETLALTSNAIVEFSLTDLEMRFSGDQKLVNGNIIEVYAKLTKWLPFVFYISRTEGLISVSIDEFVEILLVEQTVGDFLFSKIKHDSISVQAYCLRKIRVLQHENHLRILENQTRTNPPIKKFFRLRP